MSKAQFLQPHTQGLVIADDSGLEVDHLNGRPGVHSKRYSLEGTAQANNSKLLQEMNDSSARSARFRCVLAIYDGTTHHFIQGTCEGEIGTEIVGSEGFGYDPIFIPTGMNGLSMAQISMTEKNEVSHRGRALKGLKQWLLQNPTGF